MILPPLVFPAYTFVTEAQERLFVPRKSFRPCLTLSSKDIAYQLGKDKHSSLFVRRVSDEGKVVSFWRHDTQRNDSQRNDIQQGTLTEEDST